MLGHSLRFSNAYIARRKAAQVSTFVALRGHFAEVYDRARAYDDAAYTTPWWDGEAEKLEAAFLPEPPADFLRNPTLRWAMVVNDPGLLDLEMPGLEAAHSSEHLLAVLEEDVVGGQVLNVARYHTSLNSVHHAYHIHRFTQATGCDLASVGTVVEWGGGYGDLAKLFLRWARAEVTYVMVDIPLMSAVQWLYLSCVLGPERVALIDTPEAPIEAGKVNILPVGLVDARAPEADLLISTWALSESSAAAQQLVADRDWFGARRLLLAYQDSNDEFAAASDVGVMAKARGAAIHPIDFMPGSYYAFL